VNDFIVNFLTRWNTGKVHGLFFIILHEILIICWTELHYLLLYIL